MKTVLIFARGVPSEVYPLNGIFEFDQAKALSKAGNVKVIYISLDLRSFRKFRKIGYHRFFLEDICIYNLSLPIGPIYYKLFNKIGKIATRFLFKEIVKNHGRPDLVHAHFTVYSGIASVLKREYNIPFVITEHSSLITKKVLSKSTRYWVDNSYVFADRIIAVSQSLADSIYEKFGLSTSVIHNTVDLDVFTVTNRKQNDVFQFVSVGSLVYGKGFDLLLNSFALLDLPNVSLKIIGDGPLRAKLEQMVIDLNLGRRVFFLGKLSRQHINQCFKQSRAFVLASRGETFGVSYIEAMAAGLPVIGTDCGGPSEFITEENGILVEKDSISEVTEAMRSMYHNISHYDSNVISDYVRERFSSKVIAGELSELYNEVLGN